jgi:hypothetical protein
MKMNEFGERVKVFLVILVVVSPVFLPARGSADETVKGAIAEAESEPDPNARDRAQWTVPSTFLSWAGGNSFEAAAAADPFADPETQKIALRSANPPKKILEYAGVDFPAGASVEYFPRSSLLVVVNTLEQLNLIDAYLWSGCDGVEKQIYVFVEWIEVKAVNYHTWMFENRITQDGTALRRQVQQWVKAGEGKILETSALNTRSGQRSKTESHRFLIYPSENHPPQVPEKVTMNGKGLPAPLVLSSSSAVECRNVGVTTEVDAVLGADELTIDISLAPEIVSRNGYSNWPPEAGGSGDITTIPTFHTMKVSTLVTLHSGQYAILGTTRAVNAAGETNRESIILAFVRGDVRKGGHGHSRSSPQPVKVENP